MGTIEIQTVMNRMNRESGSTMDDIVDKLYCNPMSSTHSDKECEAYYASQYEIEYPIEIDVFEDINEADLRSALGL